MKIIVTGGRHYADKKRVSQVLSHIGHLQEIVQGGATGADFLARQYAVEHHIPCTTYMAEWDRFGVTAGIRRNVEMAHHPGVGMCVAFPGGSGTTHMVMAARKNHIPVIVVKEKQDASL